MVPKNTNHYCRTFKNEGPWLKWQRMARVKKTSTIDTDNTTSSAEMLCYESSCQVVWGQMATPPMILPTAATSNHRKHHVYDTTLNVC